MLYCCEMRRLEAKNMDFKRKRKIETNLMNVKKKYCAIDFQFVEEKVTLSSTGM